MIYSITEGQQAEEYKTRKAKEAEDIRKAENERFVRRYNKTDEDRGGRKLSDSQLDRAFDMVTNNASRCIDSIAKKSNNPNGAFIKARNIGVDAMDATIRHMRRHPDQYKESCGIFSSIDFI